mmetsp:Transcript_24461/g.85047  ORF Transcript_24461/g.85047 Transcript_24461/m.85047 type:complete len:240 (+) Transcript_24461:1056-1775(+)
MTLHSSTTMLFTSTRASSGSVNRDGSVSLTLASSCRAYALTAALPAPVFLNALTASHTWLNTPPRAHRRSCSSRFSRARGVQRRRYASMSAVKRMRPSGFDTVVSTFMPQKSGWPSRLGAPSARSSRNSAKGDAWCVSYLIACSSCGNTNSRSRSDSCRRQPTACARTAASPKRSSSSSSASTGSLNGTHDRIRRRASRTRSGDTHEMAFRNLGSARGCRTAHSLRCRHMSARSTAVSS